MTRPVSRAGKMLLTVVLAMAGFLGESGCTPEQVLNAVGADAAPILDVVPAAVSMEIGQIAFLTPRLNGFAIDSDTPAWTSSNPQVATVDAQGNVTCVGVGTASITARIEQDGPDDSVGTAEVTCVAPVLFELGETALEHVHIIGESPCPDTVGEFTITNRSSGAIVVDVDPANSALRANVGRIRLEPGEMVSVTILFDCSVRLPITLFSQLSVTATDAQGRKQTATLAVALTIRQ